MSQLNILRFRLLAVLGLIITMTALSMSVVAAEPVQIILDPGFRPESQYAAGFHDDTRTARIAVLPTIVRRVDRTAQSFASQQQIVAFLNESGIATAVAKPLRVDLGPLRRPSQWEIFQYGAESITESLEGYETGTDYTLVMEFLVPGDQVVFGIDVYIMDRQGQSTFSFLLNSHHRLFAEADLAARGSSEAARSAMIEKATDVGLTALVAQIRHARECIAVSASTAPKVDAGTLRDFEDELTSGKDPYGTSIGFSTFSDGKSSASIALTHDHPPVPGEAAGNKVLELNLDVQGWAGVVDIFHNDTVDEWTPYDWSDLDGFSFWLYGNNSGTKMFVDVIDNRNPCSRRDDAERYTYEFWDDVPGWRLISVPFKDMARKQIGNGAPNDGLNLAEVHGWGIGTSDTGGSRTFYIDDFRLWSEPSVGRSPEGEVTSHRLFLETRIDESTSRIAVEPGKMVGLVVEKTMDLMCETARLTTEREFRYFRMDERVMLSGGRATFRLTFYTTPPEGIPVARASIGTDLTEGPDAMTAVLDAEEFVEVCRMLGGPAQDPN